MRTLTTAVRLRAHYYPILARPPATSGVGKAQDFRDVCDRAIHGKITHSQTEMEAETSQLGRVRTSC